MSKVHNETRKKISLLLVEKLNVYSRTNLSRKKSISFTYVPFYDKQENCKYHI